MPSFPRRNVFAVYGFLFALCIYSATAGFAQNGSSLSEAELQRLAAQAAAAPAKPEPNAGLGDELSFLNLVVKVCRCLVLGIDLSG